MLPLLLSYSYSTPGQWQARTRCSAGTWIRSCYILTITIYAHLQSDVYTRPTVCMQVYSMYIISIQCTYIYYHTVYHTVLFYTLYTIYLHTTYTTILYTVLFYTLYTNTQHIRYAYYTQVSTFSIQGTGSKRTRPKRPQQYLQMQLKMLK